MSRYPSTSQFTPSGVAEPTIQEAGKADIARHDRDGSPSDSESSAAFKDYAEHADNEGSSPGACVLFRGRRRAQLLTASSMNPPRRPVSCPHVPDIERGWHAKASDERVHDLRSETASTDFGREPNDADRRR